MTTRSFTPLSYQQSQSMLAAGVAAATEIGAAMNIAIVDEGAHLHAFVRMDGAMLGSIDVAVRKATTSRMFNAPSGALGALTQPGGEIFGIEVSNGGLITFAGGVPIRNPEGVVIGAVGVSGGSAAQDEEVAKAAAAALS